MRSRSTSQFSLTFMAGWVGVLALAFACLRTVDPSIRSEDFAPLAIGGCLFGVGLAIPIIFLHRVCRESVAFLFGGMLGADVAAASGLVAVLSLFAFPLDFLPRNSNFFPGYMIIIVPIMGLFFGGVGGCVGSTHFATQRRRITAMAIGAGLPLGLLGIPWFFGSPVVEGVFLSIMVMMGILSTLAGRWLSVSRRRTHD